MSTNYTTYTVTVTMEVTAPAAAELSTNNISDAIEHRLFEFDGDLGQGIEIDTAYAVANVCDEDEYTDEDYTTWGVRFENELGASVEVEVVELTVNAHFDIEKYAREENEIPADYYLAGIRIIATGEAAQ